MRTLITILLGFITSLNAQTVIRYDYMETWNWVGNWWTPSANVGWFTNASVSPTESAVLYGSGSSTSTIEQNWYSLPNVMSLNPAYQYVFRFRLASYTFSSSTATTRGVDVADYVSVQVSTNGGVSYTTELRITGNSNATWPYNTASTINHVANGSFTNSFAPAGDVYQPPVGASNGYSNINLTLPAGLTQVAVDIQCRVNSAGEEWWIDNIELLEIGATSLPVELISFEGIAERNENVILWKTASEHNSDYYVLKRAVEDLSEYETIGTIKAAGHSTEVLEYTFADCQYENRINYYVLVQVDHDGNSKEYGPISIDNRKSTTIVSVTNLMGQQVGLDASGILIITYDDGSSKKIFNK